MTQINKALYKDENGDVYYFQTSGDMIVEDENNRLVTDHQINTWNAKAPTTVASTTANGLMSSTDKKKLDGVEEGANKYTHPSTHAASMITQDSTHRFATDTEKATWNGKASTSVASTTANGLMSSDMVTKLNGIATGANKYTHPTTSGNKHIPSGGSENQILRWSADGTAKWDNPDVFNVILYDETEYNPFGEVVAASESSEKTTRGVAPEYIERKLRANKSSSEIIDAIMSNKIVNFYFVKSPIDQYLLSHSHLIPISEEYPGVVMWLSYTHTEILQEDIDIESNLSYSGHIVMEPGLEADATVVEYNWMSVRTYSYQIDEWNAKDKSEITRYMTIFPSNWQDNTQATDGTSVYPFYADITVNGLTANHTGIVNLTPSTKVRNLITDYQTMTNKLRVYAKKKPASDVLIDNFIYWQVL